MTDATPHPRSGTTPAPGKGDEVAKGSENNVNSTLGRIKSPREIRVLRALLAGAIRREHLDRVAGASNSPDLAMRLRRNFDLRIACDTSKPVTDRDGRKAYPGVYSLHPDDRPKAVQLLNDSGVTDE